MGKKIVGIGDCVVSNDSEDEIKTYALGSCVAVIILDPKTRSAGMVHIALPDSSINLKKAKELPGYFADTGIDYLVGEMKSIGARVGLGTIVKLAGGAMVIDDNDKFAIGQRNITEIKKILWSRNLLITAEDLGDNFSRTVNILVKNGHIEVSSSNGEVWRL